MCKNLKIKFIITIIAIMFLALVIPSITNKSLAVANNGSDITGTHKDNLRWDNNNIYEWNKKKKNDEIYLSASFFRDNKFTFCIQHGQKLDFGKSPNKMPKYKLSDKIYIDGSTSEYLNGLAYILNQTSDRDLDLTKEDWTNYQKDSIQLALWKYIDIYYEELNDALTSVDDIYQFPEQGLIYRNKANEYLVAKKRSDDGNEYTVAGGKDDQIGEKSYEILTAAESLITNTAPTTCYYANVYVLSHQERWKWYDNDSGKWIYESEWQRLMIVDNVGTIINPPKIKLNIEKSVDKGVPDNKFVFEINFKQGSSETTKKINLGKVSNKEDFIWKKSASYNPGTNKDDITVTITETSYDKDYNVVPTITIVYKYNTTNNNWGVKSSETAGSNLTTTDNKTFTLQVKNIYNPYIKLRFDKVDSSESKYLADAKITITPNSNVTNFRYWIFSKVVDRKKYRNI